MKSGPAKSGFTLIEMLLVVAIIAILVAMVVGVTKRIDDQGRERLCRETLAIIDNALEQFRDFGYEYKNASYDELDFPIDCDSFLEPDLAIVLPVELGTTTIDITPNDPCQIENSGSEVLYLFLIQVPDCRITIDKIDKSLLTNKDKNDNILRIEINPPSGNFIPLLRIIDPWGKALRYDYYDVDFLTLLPILNTKKTFPIVTSAGPDGKFDTADDIINRQPK